MAEPVKVKNDDTKSIKLDHLSLSLIPLRLEETAISDDSLMLDQTDGFIFTWSSFFRAVKAVGFLAVPFAALTISQYLLQISSLIIVGHLDELSLSSSAIAISLAAVTGFSVLMGMASALETLCGQAYGAEQYHKFGIQTHTAIFCLLMVCLPLTVLWIFMGKLLVLIGQDPLISHEAGKFLLWLLPGLFAYAILHPLLRFFQMQVLIMPALIISCFTFCLHVPICWALVYRPDLKNLGGALAMSISNWLNVVLLVLYIKFSPSCAKTRTVVSMELFRGIGEFFRFAIPSALMVCLEWWSFELVTLLSGLLPNPQRETSVLSVCFNVMATISTLSYGIGTAGSTRISNELGAGKPQAARLAAGASIFLAVVETIIVSIALFTLRRVFGYAFSSEKEVVDSVAVMAPLICLSVMMDSIQGALSGVAIGCGWQRIGAYINLGAFYLCGIPAAAVLGFILKLGGKPPNWGLCAGSLAFHCYKPYKLEKTGFNTFVVYKTGLKKLGGALAMSISTWFNVSFW